MASLTSLKRKGFTLIELLVVITILGVLAGLTLASYGGTQERARDSKRKTDLDAIKKSLELAKQDTPGAYYYPSCNPPLDGPGGVGCLLTNTKTTPNLNSGSGTPYMQNVPSDPKTATGYIFQPSGTGCTTSPNTCTTYTLIACLENSRDTQGVADATNCSTSPQKAYKITPN